MAQRPGGLAEVLERMPEDDRRPVPVYLFDFRVADVRAGCVRLEADGFTAVATKASTSVPSPAHVENRAGRQDPVQAIGER